MYKEKTENVEVYFICYKKEEVDLVETYYDEVLDIHYWYFNAYLAYLAWKEKFKKLEIGELSKILLTVAASRYLIYQVENKKYESKKEYKQILREIDKIEPQIKQIMEENKILLNL